VSTTPQPPGAEPFQPATTAEPVTPLESEPPLTPEPAVDVGTPHHDLVVPKTRASSAWAGIAVGLFVLLLVIIFIAQNTSDAPLHFLWLHGRAPVGLAILLSFVLGGIVVLLVGVARLTQMRLMARRHRRRGRKQPPG
jgi:uncharacterized integral membrane protein